MNCLKLISLNTWGGRVFKDLVSFIEAKKEEIDIFCFQEIFSSNYDVVTSKGSKLNLLEKLKEILVDFNFYFTSTISDVFVIDENKYDFDYGNVIFIKKGIEILEKDHFFVYGYKNSCLIGDTKYDSRNMQYLKFLYCGEEYIVCNLHGAWFRDFGKGDNDERLEQSKKIKGFLDNRKEKAILIGDFNLLPETQSIQILEKEMSNLITDYDIETTRSLLYLKQDKFADYALVSSKVQVLDFKVLKDEVSDHLPLYLKFN